MSAFSSFRSYIIYFGYLKGGISMRVEKDNANFCYPFKRFFYYDMEKAMEKSNVVFLLGPRKCGKTVALLQFEKNRDNVKYYNFKTLSQDESMDLFDAIKSAMKEDKDAIFLLDEITYAYRPEKKINEISIQLSEKPF